MPAGQLLTAAARSCTPLPSTRVTPTLAPRLLLLAGVLLGWRHVVIGTGGWDGSRIGGGLSLGGGRCGQQRGNESGGRRLRVGARRGRGQGRQQLRSARHCEQKGASQECRRSRRAPEGCGGRHPAASPFKRATCRPLPLAPCSPAWARALALVAPVALAEA